MRYQVIWSTSFKLVGASISTHTYSQHCVQPQHRDQFSSSLGLFLFNRLGGIKTARVACVAADGVVIMAGRNVRVESCALSRRIKQLHAQGRFNTEKCSKRF